jgi:hypothetical protein
MRWSEDVTHVGERRGAYRVLVGKLRERDRLEDLVIDERIILRWMFRKWDGDMYCIDLAQDGERWWADVNTATNLHFS